MPLYVCGRTVRNDGSVDCSGDHGYAFRVHGISWSSKPHPGSSSVTSSCYSIFIEEMHEKGEPLERALPDAGIERIRPVMITVSATILALFPLALEGGPLWKPLCYAQIGGLAVNYFHHLAVGPGLLLDFRARSKVDQMGNDRRPTVGPRSKANDNVTKAKQVNKRILILGQSRRTNGSGRVNRGLLDE